VLSALSDFVSNDARSIQRVAANSRQGIEHASEFPCSRDDCWHHTAQALSSTRFSAAIDALRSRERTAIATSLPQRAHGLPHDSACSRVTRALSRKAP